MTDLIMLPQFRSSAIEMEAKTDDISREAISIAIDFLRHLPSDFSPPEARVPGDGSVDWVWNAPHCVTSITFIPYSEYDIRCVAVMRDYITATRTNFPFSFPRNANIKSFIPQESIEIMRKVQFKKSEEYITSLRLDTVSDYAPSPTSSESNRSACPIGRTNVT